MTITFPDATLAARDLSEQEIKAELALSLYSQGRLTSVQAADLAEMGFFEFQALLKARSIPQHYSEEDLAADEAAIANLP